MTGFDASFFSIIFSGLVGRDDAWSVLIEAHLAITERDFHVQAFQNREEEDALQHGV